MYNRGFDVEICCDGKPLKEYDVGEYDDEGEPTIECYIASEAGKEFTISWYEETAGTDMVVKCYVDGQLVDSTAHFADEGSGDLRGVIVSEDRYRPFIFEEVRRTSNSNVSAPGSIDGLFGTIVVTLTEVDYWRPARKRTRLSLETVEDPRPIHVNDDVEGGHTVCFGKPRTLPGRGRRNGYWQVPIDCEDAEPFLCFCFIYWPQEALLAKGVIPQLSPDYPNTRDSRSPSIGERGRAGAEDREDSDSDIEFVSDNDDGTAVNRALAQAGKPSGTATAQVQAEVREIEAQIEDLRRQLEMKKKILDKSGKTARMTTCPSYASFGLDVINLVD